MIATHYHFHHGMRQHQKQHQQQDMPAAGEGLNRLKTARTEAGLSQVELAVRAGIQPGLLCRYERGVAPSQRNADRLAKALGVEARPLFPDFDRLRPY